MKTEKRNQKSVGMSTTWLNSFSHVVSMIGLAIAKLLFVNVAANEQL